MGWNGWNFFGEFINGTLVKETVDSMAKKLVCQMLALSTPT